MADEPPFDFPPRGDEPDCSACDLEPHDMHSWPTCPSRITMFGLDLRCVLPQHHLMDGADEHETEDGMRWVLINKFDDGREVRA